MSPPPASVDGVPPRSLHIKHLLERSTCEDRECFEGNSILTVPQRTCTVRLISDLRYLPEMFRDSTEERSNPLFLDLPDDEKYLHPDYEAQLERLRTLGLKDLTPEEMVDRVERDVKSKLFSYKRTNVEDIWHTRVAMFFLFY